MSEIPGHEPAPGWERREPPDYEFEPSTSEEPDDYEYHPDDFGDEDEHIDFSIFNDFEDDLAFAAEQSRILPETFTGERHDGAGEHDLFAGAVIVETEDQLEFHVPTRLVETAEYGIWTLDVQGYRRWFKEQEDYGELRFTPKGVGMWIPHMYPFEETDEDRLPLIMDRERLEVLISMRKLTSSTEEPYPMRVKLDTENGEYIAEESVEYFNPDGICYFPEFEWLGHKIAAYKVNWIEPKPKRPLIELWEKMVASGEIEKYRRMIKGEEPMPPEFSAKAQSPNVITKDKHELDWNAFGEVWVPVELLRSGNINAKISFPDFQ